MFQQVIRVYTLSSNQFEEIAAWVDSGSTYTWLPSSLLQRLGVQPTAQREFMLADGTRLHRGIAQARLQLADESFYSYCVFGDDNSQALLGAVALEEAGLGVDPVNRRLVAVPGYALTAIENPQTGRLRNTCLVVGARARENSWARE